MSKSAAVLLVLILSVSASIIHFPAPPQHDHEQAIKNILLTNDDGWATAMIRAQYNALKAAGHSVSLLDPARSAILADFPAGHSLCSC